MRHVNTVNTACRRGRENKNKASKGAETEPGNTAPWLDDTQSRGLNTEFWLVVQLILSVTATKGAETERKEGFQLYWQDGVEIWQFAD